MRAPRPDCPHCQGGGDREVVTRDAQGLVVVFAYEPCPCRYTRPELDEAEENA